MSLRLPGGLFSPELTSSNAVSILRCGGQDRRPGACGDGGLIVGHVHSNLGGRSGCCAEIKRPWVQQQQKE